MATPTPTPTSLLILTLLSTLLLTSATSAPLPALPPLSPLQPSLSRRTTTNHGPLTHTTTITIVGVLVGIFVLSILLWNCRGCFTGDGRGCFATNIPGKHTFACNTAHARRQSGPGAERETERICTCAPGEGVHAPVVGAGRERKLPLAMMAGERELPLDAETGRVVDGERDGERGEVPFDGCFVLPRPLPAAAPASTPVVAASAGAAGAQRVDVDTPPYSPTTYSPQQGGIGGLAGPEPAVLRSFGEQGALEGSGGNAPEIRTTGVWGRWAA